MQKKFGLILLALAMGCVFAQAQEDATSLVEDVGVTEHLGDTIDLNLKFTDRHGKELSLKELVNGDKPTILVPVYYSCPGLCTAVLSSVHDLIKNVSLNLGEEYQVVNVSFDPTNLPMLAKAKAENYRSTLPAAERQAAKAAWYFLTGQQENITTLMNQIGFRYKYVNDQYSHAAVLVVLSPEGKITRYLQGVGMTPRDVKLAVIEASGGTVGSPLDRALSMCFRYDPLAGKYTPLAWTILRIGGVLTLIFMSAVGWYLWKSEFLKKRRLDNNV